jgi:hypothetical protein
VNIQAIVRQTFFYPDPLTCSIGYILHVFVYPPFFKICLDFIQESRRVQYGNWSIFSTSFLLEGTSEVLNESCRNCNTYTKKVLGQVLRFRG